LELKSKEKKEIIGEAIIPERPETNLWKDAFRRLYKNKMAVLGGIIIIILFILAIFAPYIAPYHYAEGSLKDNYANRETYIYWVLILWVEMYLVELFMVPEYH